MKRIYGIDLLRILSMLMVVTLHILLHGNVLSSTEKFSSQYFALWSLDLTAYCAVNCYALISGFVGIRSKFKYSNIINLYLTVVFYMLAINGIFAALGMVELGIKDILICFIPFRSNNYWYFRAYFCMFFFIPFFNHLINSLDKKKASTLVFMLLLIFSVLPTFTKKDMFVTADGYSPLWLSALYLIGAYIGKFGLPIKKKTHWAGIFVIATAVPITTKFIFTYLSEEHMPFLDSFENMFVNYCSPFMVLAAVALLMFFVSVDFPSIAQKLITFFAPLSFSVYLIHENSLIRNNVIKKYFSWIAALDPVLAVLCVIGCAIGIFLICSLIDKVRYELFKLLKIKNLSAWAEEKIIKRLFSY